MATDYYGKTGKNAVREALKSAPKRAKTPKRAKSKPTKSPAKQVEANRASYAKDMEEAFAQGWKQVDGRWVKSNPDAEKVSAMAKARSAGLMSRGRSTPPAPKMRRHVKTKKTKRGKK